MCAIKLLFAEYTSVFVLAHVLQLTTLSLCLVLAAVVCPCFKGISGVCKCTHRFVCLIMPFFASLGCDHPAY